MSILRSAGARSAALLLLALAAPAAANDLPEPVARVLARAGIGNDGLSLWVQDVTAREPLLALDPDTPRNPASVMKLVTTLAALEILGPAYQWSTRVYAGGPISKGRLDGDLYLRGGGDPYIVTETFWLLLRAIREKGVDHVAGDLVIDGSYFDTGPLDPGAFDGKPYRSYNATPEGFLLNFKATRFDFRPDPESGQVAITTDPPTEGLEIDNRLRLVDGRCRGRHFRLQMHVDRDRPGHAVRFSGDYPTRCGSYEIQRTVFDPVPYVFAAFKSLWREIGGRIDGSVRTERVPESARAIVLWRSRPLAELIRSINKYSNNLMTRQLLLTLGAEHGGEPGTVEKGRDAISQWLATKGLDADRVFVDNGSGLSRDARIEARALARLLLAAYAGPYMPEFVSSMPLSAIDGTLRRRFNDGPLSGQVHMKTGLIDDVRALAGYMLTRSGRTFVVVLLHNRHGIHNTTGTLVQDALLEWLYEQ